MFESLKDQFTEVIPLGPLKIRGSTYIALKILGFLHIRFLGGQYNPWHSKTLGKSYAVQVSNKLKNLNLDVIYAPKASTAVSYLKTKIPICYSSDMSFGQIIDFYPDYSNFSYKSKLESFDVENKAIQNSDNIVFQTEWARQYFLDNHKYERENVFVIKHGANLESWPNPKLLERDYSKRINILFIGVEWIRKGGDIVFETFQILVNMGYDVTLSIVGCTPPETHERMKVYPFLNKNIPEERRKFEKLLIESHLFLLPTRADCMPVANSEACAYGLPVITTNVGGVKDAIIDGYNGIVLEINDNAELYSTRIANLLNDRSLMLKMSSNARSKFEEDLNWKEWGKKTKAILLETANVE